MARSRRYEFSKEVKRQANARSGGLCEAVGVAYGLSPGQRCNAPLRGKRREYDHYPLPATMEGSDTLDNCVVCCTTCHAHKTRTLDIPIQAKTKRVSDKAQGIRPAPKLRGQGFRKAPSQSRATTPIQPKFEGDVLARRQVYCSDEQEVIDAGKPPAASSKLAARQKQSKQSRHPYQAPRPLFQEIPQNEIHRDG